jgi:hypothetical protein
MTWFLIIWLSAPTIDVTLTAPSPARREVRVAMPDQRACIAALALNQGRHAACVAGVGR